MNRPELAAKIAERLHLQKKQVEDILAGFEAEVTEALRQGGEVTLTGFGQFLVRERSARGGVNPRNPQQRIQVPAVKVAKFRTGKNLKDALKGVGRRA